MKTIIEQDEIGLVYENGIYTEFILPGKFTTFFSSGVKIDRHKINEQFLPAIDLDYFLKDKKLATMLDVVDVKDDQIALHFANGHLKNVLRPGKAAFWNTLQKNEFQYFDFANPEIPDTLPVSILANPLVTPFIQVIQVSEYETSLMFFNSKYQKTLSSGKYYLFNGPVRVTAQNFDMRQQQLDMAGQEMMTQDKVTLRLNMVCQFRIQNALQVYQKVKEYEKQLYVAIQLILREYVGMLKLDELLDKKEEVGTYVIDKLQQRAGDWGLEYLSAGIKDVILPGEIKTILNRVIEAEKKAAANVITRREETASTRSLLNTARLMEENPTLMKLKEWEYIDGITSRIGNLSLSSDSSLLSQLSSIFTKNRTD